jgi:hypothetical protein
MDQHPSIEDSQLSAYATSNVFYTASTSTGSIDDGHQAQGNPTLHQGHADAQNQTMEFEEMRYSAMLLVENQQESHQVAPKESEQDYQLQDIDEKVERDGVVSDRSLAREKENDDVSRQISALKQMLLDACTRAEFYRRERNFFRSLADKQLGAEALYSRPLSPKMRFLSTATSYTFPSTNDDGSDGCLKNCKEESRSGSVSPDSHHMAAL